MAVLIAACIAVAASLAFTSNANASFDLKTYTLKAYAPGSTTTEYTQAGGHPDTEYRGDFDAKLADNSNGDDLKKFEVEYPAGALANPESAAPKCTATQFSTDKCPNSSFIGTLSVQYRIKLTSSSALTVTAPGSVYVLTPNTTGSAVTVGFIIRPPGYRLIFLKNEVKGVAAVRTGVDADYGLTLTMDNIQRTLTSTWGSTVNATVDYAKVNINSRTQPNRSGGYFNVLPTRCAALKTKLTAVSYAGVSESMQQGNTITTTGCNNVPFAPTASVTPNDARANQSTGWTATFGVPVTQTIQSPDNIQQSHVRNITVDLPEGTGLDFPAIAAVPALCTDSQLNADTCPAGSKIGTASAAVPFLPPTMTGDIYLRSRGTFVTFGYILRGANGVKAALKGEVRAVDTNSDGAADRVRASAVEMPQAPWTTASLNFTSKLATNPNFCGTRPVKSVLDPYSGQASVTKTNDVTFTPPATGSCPGVGNQAPVVTITSPPNNTTTTNSTIPINYTVTDDTTPVGSLVCSQASGTNASLVIGTNTIIVSCTDADGATGTASVTVIRNANNPPVVNLTNLPDWTTASSISVSWTATDDSGTPTCTVSNNGSPVAAAATSPVNVALVNGPNAISVSCTDGSNTTTTPVDTVRRDNANPVVTVGSTPAWTQSASQSISWTVTDDQDPTPANACTVRNNGTAVASAPHTSPLNVALVNGVNAITVTCVDEAGNSGVSATATIRRDNAAPVVTISSPTDGQNLPSGTTSIPVTWTVTDDQDPTPASNCTVAVNGTTIAGAPHTSGITVPVTSGPNSIRVTCIDEAGNSGQDTNSTVSVPAPIVEITNPADGSWTTSASTTVTFTVNGSTTIPAGTTCAITRNGTTVTNPVALVNAQNTIVVTCTNASGAGSDTNVVRRDNAAPVVTLGSTPAWTTAASQSISWTVTDDQDPTPANNCTVRNNGTAVAGAPHTSPLNVALVNGVNAITVTCLDEAANSGVSSTATIRRDNVTPTVTITAPTDGSSVAQGTTTVPVTWTVTDDQDTTPASNCTVAVNGTDVAGAPHTSGVSVPVSGGTNAIRVTCVDEAGNSGQDINTVTVSSSLAVDITSPLDNSWTTSATLTTLTYSVTPSAGATCSITRNGTAVTLPISLVNGVNTIVVSCTNGSGGSGSDTVTVRRDNANPVVTIGSTPAWTTAATQSISWTVTDDQDPTPANNCTVRNNGTAVAGAPHTSPLSVALVNGVNAITVTCLDEAGNSGVSSTATIRRDNTTPTVTISSPNDGATLAAGTTTVPVTWTVTDDQDTTPASNCTVAVNGTNVAGAPHTSGVSVPVSGGSNAIRVTCVDDAGNSGQDINTVTVTTPLAVVITTPNDGAWTTASSQAVTFTVNGSTTVPAGTTCTITNNGGAAVTSPVTLVNGVNAIRVACSNSSGNGEDTNTIRRDNAAPVITLGSLPVWTNGSTVSVSWTATDDQDPTPVNNCTVSNNSTALAGAPHNSPQTVTLVNGVNNISVACADEAGNSGTASATVRRDTAAPAVTIATPTDGSTLPQGTASTSVTWTVTDDQDPTPASACTVSNNGTNVAGAPHSSPLTVPLVAGINDIRVICLDEAGNSGQDTNRVTVTTPVTVEITNPVDGAWTTSATQAVAFTVNGSATVPAGTTCTITNNGGSAVTSPVALVNGANAIRVACVNATGSGEDTNTIRRDNAVPVVTLGSLPAWTTATSVSVGWTVTDDQDTTPASNCTVSNNGTALAGAPHASPQSVTLVNGTNNIAVACADNAGNTGTSSFTVRRDNAVPVVTIGSTPAWTTAATQSISWTVTDDQDPTPANNCTVRNNGTAVAGAPHTSALSVALVNGVNAITVTCLDEAGNSGVSSTATIRRDNANPVVTLGSTPAWTTAATQSVSWTATDDQDPTPANNCTVRNNGTAVAGAPHTSPLSVSLVEGVNAITVTCIDEAGNSGVSGTATIRRDTIAPAVTISSPADGATLAAGTTSVAVAFAATDAQDTTPASNCTVSVNGTDVAGAPHATGVTVPLTGGSNAIRVRCADDAGNVGEDTNTVTVTVPLLVEITSPADGSWTQSASQTVTFTVNGSATIPAGTTCSITRNGTTVTNPVSLVNAQNTIVVSCSNASGAGSDTNVVRRDNAAPTVSVTAIPAWTTAATQSVAWTVTDDQDPTPANNCTVRNNGTAVAGAPHTSPLSVALVNGVNAITVTCIDEAGNANTPVTNTIRRDNANPTVTISSPNDGATLAAGTTTVPVNWGVTDDQDTTPASNCTVAVNGTNVAGAPHTSGVSVPVSDGSNAIRVTCLDEAGNSGQDTNTVTVTTPITVVIGTPVDGSWTQAATQAVSFTVNGSATVPAGTTCTITNNGGSAVTSPVTLVNGANAIRVACVSATGSGEDTNTVRKDNANPTVTIGSTPAWTTAATQSVSWIVSDDQDPTPANNCTVRNNGTAVAGAPHTSPLSVALVNGVNAITVTCIDEAGNSGVSSTATIRRDNITPTVTITAPTQNQSLPTGTTTTNIVWTSTDDQDPTPAGNCTVTVNGTVRPSAPHTSPLSVPVVPGANTASVSCTDEAGNVGSSGTRNFEVQNVSLETTITKFADPSTDGVAAQTVEFTGTGSAFQCRVNSGTFTTCTSPWTVPTAGMTNATVNTYDVRATDGAPTPVVDATPARGHIWYDTRTWNAIPSVQAQSNSLTPAADVMKAGRHPDVAASIALEGYDDALSVNVKFPDGLMGSLAAIPTASRCSLTQANAGTCPASSRMGALSGLATNPRDGDLTATGDLYLVDSGDAAIPKDTAAAVALELTAPNNLGKIRAIGYIKLVKTTVGSSASNEGPIDGSRSMSLVVPSIPRSTIASTTPETRLSALRFHARSVTVTLDGDVGGTTGSPAKSLVTNPHYCGTVFTNASWARPDQKRFVGSGTGYNGSSVSNVTADYAVTTGCSEAVFNPTLTMATVDQAGAPVTTAGTGVRMLVDFQLPAEAASVPNATIGRAVAMLPPQISPRFSSFGASTDRCPVASVVRPTPPPTYQGFQWFDPISLTSGLNLCTNTAARALNSKVGTATITTPLTENPLKANIYFVDASPIPYLGIWVDPSVDPSNPKGVTAGIFATTSTEAYPAGNGGTSLVLTMNSVPDLPVTRLQLDIGNQGTRAFGAPILDMAAPTDPACVPKPGDDPGTPFNDATAVPGKALTRMLPWTKITSDNLFPWTGSTGSNMIGATATLPPGTTELQNDLPITGCELPE